MSNVNLNSMFDYKWSDYDDKIKPKGGKTPGALENALADKKLTGAEIETLKEQFMAAKSGATDQEFFTALEQSTGINANTLADAAAKSKSAPNEPVEFTFTKSMDKIVAAKNEKGTTEFAGLRDAKNVDGTLNAGKMEIKDTSTTKSGSDEAAFRDALGGTKKVEVSKETKEQVKSTYENYDWVPSNPLIRPTGPKPQYSPFVQNPEVTGNAKKNGWEYKKVGEETVTSEKVTPAKYKTMDAVIEGGKKEDIKELQKAINANRPEGSPKITEDGALGPKTLAAVVENFKKNPNDPANMKMMDDIFNGKYGTPPEKVKDLLKQAVADVKSGGELTAENKNQIIKDAVPKVIDAAKNKAQTPEDWAQINSTIGQIKQFNPKAGEMVETKVKEIATGRANDMKEVNAQNIGEAKALAGSGFITADHPLHQKIKDFEAKSGEIKGETDKLAGKNTTEIMTALKGMNPPEKAGEVFAALAKEDPYKAGQVLKYMQPKDFAANMLNTAVERGETDSITKALEKADIGQRAEILLKMKPENAAKVMDKMDPEKLNETINYRVDSVNTHPQNGLFGQEKDNQKASDILGALAKVNPSKAADIVANMRNDAMGDVRIEALSKMKPEDAGAIINAMPEPKAKEIIGKLAANPEGRKELHSMLHSMPDPDAAKLMSKFTDHIFGAVMLNKDVDMPTDKVASIMKNIPEPQRNQFLEHTKALNSTWTEEIKKAINGPEVPTPKEEKPDLVTTHKISKKDAEELAAARNKYLPEGQKISVADAAMIIGQNKAREEAVKQGITLGETSYRLQELPDGSFELETKVKDVNKPKVET